MGVVDVGIDVTGADVREMVGWPEGVPGVAVGSRVDVEGRLDSEGEGVGFPGVMLGRSEGSSVGEAEFDGESLGIPSVLAEGLGDSDGDSVASSDRYPGAFVCAVGCVGSVVKRRLGTRVSSDGASFDIATLVILSNPAALRFESAALLKLSTATCKRRRTASLNNSVLDEHKRHFPLTLYLFTKV